jgi:hypothetical protein
MIAAGKQVEARLVHPGDLAKNQQYFFKLEADTGTKIDCHQNPCQPTRTARPLFERALFRDRAGRLRSDSEFLRRLESGTIIVGCSARP